MHAHSQPHACIYEFPWGHPFPSCWRSSVLLSTLCTCTAMYIALLGGVLRIRTRIIYFNNLLNASALAGRDGVIAGRGQQRRRTSGALLNSQRFFPIFITKSTHSIYMGDRARSPINAKTLTVVTVLSTPLCSWGRPMFVCYCWAAAAVNKQVSMSRLLCTSAQGESARNKQRRLLGPQRFFCCCCFLFFFFFALLCTFVLVQFLFLFPTSARGAPRCRLHQSNRQRKKRGSNATNTSISALDSAVALNGARMFLNFENFNFHACSAQILHYFIFPMYWNLVEY